MIYRAKIGRVLAYLLSRMNTKGDKGPFVRQLPNTDDRIKSLFRHHSLDDTYNEALDFRHSDFAEIFRAQKLSVVVCLCMHRTGNLTLCVFCT